MERSRERQRRGAVDFGVGDTGLVPAEKPVGGCCRIKMPDNLPFFGGKECAVGQSCAKLGGCLECEIPQELGDKDDTELVEILSKAYRENFSKRAASGESPVQHVIQE